MKMIEKDCRIDGFGCLDPGEVFRFGKAIAMKVEEHFTDSDGGTYNAIDLETGEFCYFADYNEVERLNAELIIK